MRLIAAILFLLNQLLYLGVAFIAPATAINTGKKGVGESSHWEGGGLLAILRDLGITILMQMKLKAERKNIIQF